MKKKKLASVNYFARLSGCTVKSVYDNIKSGRIKAEIVKLGKREVYYIDLNSNEKLTDGRKLNKKVPELL